MSDQSQGWASDVAEIVRLLDEAYTHYFATSDGYCKSSEGYVSVEFPNYFARLEGATPKVSVYSYVLGPSRMHDFASSADALAAVREWHHREMTCEEDRR